MDLKYKLLMTEVATLQVGSPPDQQPMLALRHRTRDGNGKDQTLEWLAVTPQDAQTLIATLQGAVDLALGKPQKSGQSPRH